MTTITAHARVFAPTEIHRAIDQATILKVELQHLQNLIQFGATIGPERLRRMEQVVDRLASALITCRDQNQR